MKTATQEKLTKSNVTRVLDGDTIEISTGERVRFIGVDAPELNTPGGTEATDFVRNLVLNKDVWLEADGNNRDGRGRLRRYVWIRQPTDTGDRKQVEQHQLNALLLAYGLAEVLIVGNVRHEALFNEIAKVAFIGTAKSKVFHLANCRSVPVKGSRTYFSSRREAITAGYRSCNNCRP